MYQSSGSKIGLFMGSWVRKLAPWYGVIQGTGGVGIWIVGLVMGFLPSSGIISEDAGGLVFLICFMLGFLWMAVCHWLWDPRSPRLK